MTHRNDLITSDAEAVTTSDTATKRYSGLYIGTGGDVKVTTAGGTDVTFVNTNSGQIIPLTITKVFATGTTATNIVGFFN
jgi:hypothetical protein